jgi:hypothetical protein
VELGCAATATATATAVAVASAGSGSCARGGILVFLILFFSLSSAVLQSLSRTEQSILLIQLMQSHNSFAELGISSSVVPGSGFRVPCSVFRVASSVYRALNAIIEPHGDTTTLFFKLNMENGHGPWPIQSCSSADDCISS